VRGAGRELGEGVRRERERKMVGREEGVDWGGGVKNDTWVPQPMTSAGKFRIE